MDTNQRRASSSILSRCRMATRSSGFSFGIFLVPVSFPSVIAPLANLVLCVRVPCACGWFESTCCSTHGNTQTDGARSSARTSANWQMRSSWLLM